MFAFMFALVLFGLGASGASGSGVHNTDGVHSPLLTDEVLSLLQSRHGTSTFASNDIHADLSQVDENTNDADLSNLIRDVDDASYRPNSVSMLVGTHNGVMSDGNTLPQVKRPWGFNDWVPQTSMAEPWWFHAGVNSFHGIRCTHQPSPWIGDYAHFRLLPHTSKVPKLTYLANNSLYRPYVFGTSIWDHNSSEAIHLELAPTSRAAGIRLTYPADVEEKLLTLDVGSGEFTQTDSGMEGWSEARQEGAPANMKLFIVMRVVDGEIAHVESRTASALVKFTGSHKKPVLLHIGTSFISKEQAYRNLDREIGTKSFGKLATEGRQEWQAAMSRVQVEALNDVQRDVFYTNLWKSMLFPRQLHELDEHDEDVHFSPYTAKVERGKLVADSGFWDAYHSVYPMLSLYFPEAYKTSIKGWITASNEAGWLPQWASPGQHNSMVATMGDASLADAIVKCTQVDGFDCGIDTHKAYGAIRKDAFEEGEGKFGRRHLDKYVKLGYLPKQYHEESVSVSLNYYVADSAIAKAAKALGNHADAKKLKRRSKRYPKLFRNGFFQPRGKGGKFDQHFEPRAYRRDFTEGSAWQYRFMVPHDVEGLQKLYKGKLCERMEETLQERTQMLPDAERTHELLESYRVQERFGHYSHGNQPAHEMLWVAKKAGCNELADEYLRRVMDELYTLNSYAGDEDNGEMASWYVLAALGLYQLEPGKLEIVLGSPAVRRASVTLPHDKSLLVTTAHQSEDNVRVKKVTWTPSGGSEREIKDNVLGFQELFRGGQLHFEMGPLTLPHGRLHGQRFSMSDTIQFTQMAR